MAFGKDGKVMNSVKYYVIFIPCMLKICIVELISVLCFLSVLLVYVAAGAWIVVSDENRKTIAGCNDVPGALREP